MVTKPKRVAVIGLDCALPHLMEKHIAEGHLPTFKKLIEGSVIADNCLAPFPTVTPPNWATIGTGAWAGTHGVTDFWVHTPGTSPNNNNTEEAFSSKRVKAEFLWDAVDRVGKKSIVLNYPGSWPSNMKQGIMVGGQGLSIGENRDGFWNHEAEYNLCFDQLITTDVYPLAVRGKFEEAKGWVNVPEMGEDPLEMSAQLLFPMAAERPADTTWHLLARQTTDDGYDNVTLSPTKDFKEAFCSLSVGEWSPKIVTHINMEDGSEREVFFRCKLLELSDDGDELRLYVGALNGTSGWSSPSGIAGEIVSAEGTFGHDGGLVGLVVGWYGLDTYAEINNQNAQWLADAANTLLANHDWDLFCMHSHPTDWTYHAIMTHMDPTLSSDEEKRKEAWETHLKIYETQDRMLAKILEVIEDDTLIILVSDHGATPDGPMFNPYDVLVPAGLTTLTEVQERKISDHFGEYAKKWEARQKTPDPRKSKAMPQRGEYIYVNLKGRDPEGLVDPQDYEKVQQEIIDALLSYVDPGTGRRPIAMALTRQDARMLGLYGDEVGDVIYAVYPWFGSQHGQILPTAEYGVGSLKALFTMTGPGIKKGYRLERTVWLTDLVPTICYLMNWPVPAQSEGAVIYQAFEEPNFRYAEGHSA